MCALASIICIKLHLKKELLNGYMCIRKESAITCGHIVWNEHVSVNYCYLQLPHSKENEFLYLSIFLLIHLVCWKFY